MGQVRVGTASWTDRTLLESGWYPPEADTPEKRLRYYARQFSLVEVDATYYALPAEQTATAWAARTPAAFTFNVKAFSLFTHHPTPVAALPTDLRPAAEKTGKDRVYFKDVGPALADQVWERFLAALDPLRAERKLGAILLQFPPWFPISRARKDYIVACAERAAPDRVCVEFRNRTWMTPDNQEETLGFLAEHRLPYVCVDMPQGHRDSIPPVLAATSPDLAVVRLHGHSDRWDSKDIHERFGYRYTDRELQEWAPKVRALARDPEQTHVLFNNCYRNYAQVNAQRLAELVSTEEGTALLGVQSQCGRRHRRGALPPLADLAGPKAQAPFGDTTYCPSRDSPFQAGSSGGPPLPVTSLASTERANSRRYAPPWDPTAAAWDVRRADRSGWRSKLARRAARCSSPCAPRWRAQASRFQHLTGTGRRSRRHDGPAGRPHAHLPQPLSTHVRKELSVVVFA